jgi:serpin B
MRIAESCVRLLSMNAALALALSLAGCSSAPEPPREVPATTRAQPTIEGPEQSIAERANQFGLDLYRQVGRREGSVMISPISLYGAFGPVVAGARGETRKAIVRALRLLDTGPSLNSDVGSLLGDLERQESGTTLRIANAQWVQQGFKLDPSFVATVRRDYRATIEPVDFKGQPDAAVARINAWVSERTAQRIPTMISRDAVNDRTRMIVTNAVYFLGDWAMPFNASSTSQQPFTLLSGAKLNVLLMSQRARFRYLETGGFQMIDIPYRDARLSMTVLLPKLRGDLRSLEEQLTDTRLAEWLRQLDAAEPQTVRLHLPKLEMTANYDLEQPLTALGMGIAFRGQADLRGIADADLQIAKVVHKTFLRIDEKGTEAAAATGVQIEVTSMPAVQPPTLRADHPFIVLIRDHRTQAIVFMGRIEEPQQP